MTVIFDGKLLAKKAEKNLKKEVNTLIDKGITPKIVSFYVGDSLQNTKYLNLKKKSAERLGIVMEVAGLDKDTSTEDIIGLIEEQNDNSNTHGIMLQLPLPDSFSIAERNKILNSISNMKDIDGMIKASDFIAPVVLAVDTLVEESKEHLDNVDHQIKIVVVGSEGFFGNKIIEFFYLLHEEGDKEVIGIDINSSNVKENLKTADIIISSIGNHDSITKDMIKKGAVLIDVGAPKGDISKDAYSKASFVSPVPGGVGPLAIYFLMENIVTAAQLL